MFFTSIYSTYPRTNPWNFWEKILRIGGDGKWNFVSFFVFCYWVYQKKIVISQWKSPRLSESWKRLYSTDDCNPYKNITFKKKLPHWRIGLSSPKKLPLPNQTWNQKSFGNHQIHKVAVSFHQSNSWCRNNFHKVQPEKYIWICQDFYPKSEQFGNSLKKFDKVF